MSRGCDPQRRSLYREYRRGTEGEPLIRALRLAVLVLFVIQSVFIGVDWLLFPELFARFLPVRLALNVVLGAIYFRTSRTHPLASSYATIFAGGAMLLTVVHGTGGPSSGYYVGLVLLFTGIGVLTPLSGRQAALASGVLFATYAALPWLGGGPIPWERFALHLFFLGAAVFEGVMSCVLLDRMRFGDFLQRREIEKARDELKALDREKSRFTANVHHELRTPLTLMLAPLDAMLGGEFGGVSELQRSYLATMHSNAQRLLKLINNLLDLAKIEGKQLRIARRPTQIRDLVEELLRGARPLAERKGVVLEARGLDSLPVVNADRDAVEKVIVNLIGNALKFTDRGGRIEVHGTPEPGGGIQLVVADTGVGIPEDQLERVFNRFAQVDASATRCHEGTGIGLALVKELVELHGGRIWAESEGIGRGARMRVVLPSGEPDAPLEDKLLEAPSGEALVARDAFDAIGSELGLGREEAADGRFVELERTIERAQFERMDDEESSGPAAAPPDAAEILVVEDNRDMRRLLRFLLAREFRVRASRNGREALEAIREAPPDLILTDVMMPEMSGTELCGAVKADPRTRHIPVVLVTSKAEREMKIQGLELGAEDYVTKPFHPRELLARVRSLVRLHRLQMEVAERNAELESALSELQETEVQLVQAERLAAVGELAAGVAHEVNNPVNFATNALKALRGTVDDLRRVASALAEIDLADPQRAQAHAAELEKLRREVDLDELSASLVELVGIANEGLDRTQRLVGDLRDFAAPGQGPEAAVDVAAALRSTLQLLGYAMRRAGVEARLELQVDLPRVRGEARALNQVFLNLLKNATEALEGRGGFVGVGVRREGDSLVVKIRDDGPGVAPELRPRLFEPFFSTKRAGRGSGLGLSISRRIVSEHGGTLELEPSSAPGATFVVRLPVAGGDRAP